MTVIAIAFTPAPATDSPNVRSHHDPIAAYLGAMEVAFASCARWAPDAVLRLVTTSNEVKVPGVESMLVPFSRAPAVPLGNTFAASVYSLDAMHALAAEYSNEAIVLLDPDCVVVGTMDRLFRRASLAVCAYPTGFPPDEDANGLSARSSSDLHSRLNNDLTGTPTHYGGECYAFTAATIAPVLARADDALALAGELARRAEVPRFSTEEHLMNYALRGADVDEIDDVVRRIWTAPTYRTVRGDEHNLAVWHLPAEKDRGLPLLLGPVRDRASWFWSSDGPTFRDNVGRLVGVGRRRPARWARDATGRILRGVPHRMAELVPGRS